MFDSKQLEHKDPCKFHIDAILKALQPVLSYQVEFNSRMDKFSLENEMFNESVLGQNIGKEVVDLINNNSDLWDDYTEGAVILSVPHYYEQIKAAIGVLYPIPESTKAKKNQEEMTYHNP